MRIELTDQYPKWTAARSVPGAWQDGRMWVVDDPNPRAAAVICRLFPELQDVHPALTVLRDSLMQDARPFDRATEFDTPIDAPRVHEQLRSLDCARCNMLPQEGVDPDCPVCGGTGIGNFFPFQSIDLGYLAAVLRAHNAAEIAWDRGLGKTLGACALIDNLAADRILVVAPNTSKQVVWEDELRRFCPWLDIRIMPNGSPVKRGRLMQHVRTTTNPLVLIAHYESLALVAAERSQRKGWRQYGEWDLVVADESHTLSRTTTLKHRSLMQVPTAMKLSATGSMIQNHPEEWYGRLRWMFPKVYSSKWRDWNNRYLEYVEADYGKTLIGPMPHRIEAMRAELGVFTVYRRKSDELDLPPTQEQTIKLDLNPEQRRAYNELRDELVTTLDSGETVSALEPVVLLTRLRQLATGIELLSGRLADSTKLDWTVARIKARPDSAFICFSWFKPAAVALAERLAAEGESTFLCTGDTTHKQRRDRIRGFQAGDGGRVFVGTISTLGESVNLHRANEGIFVDQSFNPAQNEQAIDRYNRIGQKQATETTKLVSRDTVDELVVLPNIANKEALRRMITGGV
jgi:SNF2 family DNA or RNA helicase